MDDVLRLKIFDDFSLPRTMSNHVSSHYLCVPSRTEPGPLRPKDVEQAKMLVYTSDHYPNGRLLDLALPAVNWVSR